MWMRGATQDFNNYDPLKSHGPVPTILIESYPDIVDKELFKLQDKDPLYYQKSQFATYSRLIISRLLLNGRLLLNDSLGNYVNQVADLLLAHDPDLRKQIHVFIVKSPVVNAYTLDNGIILINVGLLSQLESEAELAYILAHEITHFIERHSLQEFLASYKRAKEGISREEYIFETLSFSRENELIADAKGLQLLIRSNYDLTAAFGVLDVLKYSYLPFDEMPFENSFFENEDLKLPAKLRLAKIKPIDENESEDDTKSTHPNIKARRDTISHIYKWASDSITNRKKFIISDRERFRKLRTVARFEVTRLYLVSQDYPEAIYTSYLLQQEYPNSYYLKKITAIAVYNLAVYKFPPPDYDYEYDKSEYSIPNYSAVRGNLQQVYFLFSKMSSKEAATIALSYCWRLKREVPNDRQLKKMCENLIYLMSTNPFKSSSDFSEKVVQEEIGTEIDTTSELSKYDKIRLQQRLASVTDEQSHEGSFDYAFSSFLRDDKEFKQMVEKYYSAKTNIDPPQWNEDKSVRASSDTLFALAPLLLKYEYKATLFGAKPSVTYDHRTFSELQEKYRTLLKEAGVDNNVAIRFIDPTDFDSINIELYNFISDLSDWIREDLRHTRPLAMNSITSEIQRQEAKFGRYWMWNISITERSKIKNLGGMITLSVVFYPVGIFMAPFMVFHRRYQHEYYLQIIDTHKRDIIVSHKKHSKKNFKYGWIKRKMKNSFEEFGKKLDTSK